MGAMFNAFVAVAIPLLVVLAGVSYAVLREEIAVEREVAARRASEAADTVRDSVAAALGGVAADVRTLTVLETNQSVLETMALALIRTRPHAHQVRILNAEGFETLRIQRDAGRVVRLPDDQLQDKSHRSYFQAAVRLAPGEVYVSRMDLNMERRQIERPLRPTVRFAGRLPNGGVVVINLDTRALLQRLRREFTFPVWLCDGDGHFLLGPSEADDFGFILEPNAARGLADRNPELWAVARAEQQGAHWTQGQVYGFAAHQPNVGRGHSEPGARLLAVVPWARTVRSLWGKVLENLALLSVLASLSLLIAAALAYQIAAQRVGQRRAVERGELAMSLVDDAPDAVLICDRSGHILYANRSCARVLGDSPADLVGTSAQPLFVTHGDDSVHLPSDFGTKEMAKAVQRPWVRDGAKGHKLSLAVRPMGVDNSTLYLLFARDVTHEARTLALAETNRRLDEINERLVRSNQDLESFSYTLAHDLRTPIRAMSAAVGMLGQLALPAEAAPLLERARNASKRLSRLVDGTLALSRVGRTALVPVETSLSSIAESVQRELESRAPEREVEWVVADDLRAVADRRLVAELLKSLLENAFRATADATHARIEFGQTPGGEFFVRDNGVGLEIVDTDQLFEPFLARGGVESEVGGIGLAMARKIVTRQGGHIRAESTPGEGATFFFTLPAD